MPRQILFLHGLDSSSRGTKGSYFRSHFPEMLLPDFSGSLAQRLARLDELTAGQQELVMIGSSFGGLMAAIFAIERPAQAAKIILLAPALNFPDFQDYSTKTTAIPAVVYQGIHDDVTPLAQVRPLAEKVFTNLTFHELNDDHMLHRSFQKIDWSALL